MIRILPLLFFTALLFFLYKGLMLDSHRLPSALINHPFPKFQLISLENPRQKITEIDLQRRITVLNVWASWCSACLTEHLSWQTIAMTYPGLLWGLNYKDNLDLAQRWLKLNGNPYQQNIFDPQGDLAIDLGVYGTPETFLIDSKGIIRYRYVGPINQDIWQRQLLPRIQQWQSLSS